MVRLTSKLNTQVDHVFRLVKTKARWQSDSEGENVCIPSFCCLSLSSVMKTTHRFENGGQTGSSWAPLLVPTDPFTQQALCSMASVITCLSDFFFPTVSLIRSIARVQFGTRATQTRVSDWQQFFCVCSTAK